MPRSYLVSHRFPKLYLPEMESFPLFLSFLSESLSNKSFQLSEGSKASGGFGGGLA